MVARGGRQWDVCLLESDVQPGGGGAATAPHSALIRLRGLTGSAWDCRLDTNYIGKETEL